MPKLDERQLRIISGMQKPMGRSLCQSHPDWSPFFMRDIGLIIDHPETNGNIPYTKFYKFAEAFGTRGADTEAPDKIGGYGVRDLFYAMVHHCPEWIDRTQAMAERFPDDNIAMIVCKTFDPIADYDVLHIKDGYKPMRSKLKCPDSDVLLKAQMTEGDEEAAKIYDLLQYTAHDIAKESARAWKETGVIGSHLMVGRMDVLSLDDMNIRGKQIVHAFDYCDKDIRTFENCVNRRDPNMVMYVNQEMAKSGGQFIPQASSGGASFLETPPVMGPFFKETFDADMKPLEVPYVRREIYTHTPYDEAIKILEANGFEKVFDRPVDVKCPVEPWTKDKEVRNVIMHDPSTGAMLKAEARVTDSDDTFCYGGCDIVMFTHDKSGGSPSRWGLDFQRNYVRDKNDEPTIAVSTITYHDGRMMDDYQTVKAIEVPAVDDLKSVPYCKMEGFPIPTLRNYEIEMRSQTHTGSEEAKRYLQTDDILYGIQRIADCLNLEKAMRFVPEEKRALYKPFLDDKYNKTIDSTYFTNNPEKSSLAMGVAVRLTGIPKSEVDKYFEAACYCPDTWRREFKEDYLQVMNKRKTKADFYGESKHVQKIIDAFQLRPDEPLNSKTRRMPVVSDIQNDAEAQTGYDY